MKGIIQIILFLLTAYTAVIVTSAVLSAGFMFNRDHQCNQPRSRLSYVAPIQPLACWLSDVPGGSRK